MSQEDYDETWDEKGNLISRVKVIREIPKDPDYERFKLYLKKAKEEGLLE